MEGVGAAICLQLGRRELVAGAPEPHVVNVEQRRPHNRRCGADVVQRHQLRALGVRRPRGQLVPDVRIAMLRKGGPECLDLVRQCVVLRTVRGGDLVAEHEGHFAALQPAQGQRRPRGQGERLQKLGLRELRRPTAPPAAAARRGRATRASAQTARTSAPCGQRADPTPDPPSRAGCRARARGTSPPAPRGGQRRRPGPAPPPGDRGVGGGGSCP